MLQDALNLGGTSKTVCEWIYEYENGIDYYNDNYRYGEDYLFFEFSYTGLTTTIKAKFIHDMEIIVFGYDDGAGYQGDFAISMYEIGSDLTNVLE